MATLGELVIRVNANLSGLQRGLDEATSGLRRLGSSVSSVGRTLTVGLTLPIAALGATSVQAAAQMDSLRRGLSAVAGSSKEAEAQLTRLEDVAKLPGLGFREAIQGSIRLQAAGLNVALTERALRSFGNAIALTGGGKQQLDTVTTQLGQLAAKGRVLGSDLRPIIEAAPVVGEALRKAFGTVDPEQIQKLGLSTDRFLTLLLDRLDEVPKVTGGAANSFENLEDAIFKARVAIGEKLLPVVVPLIEGLAKVLEGVRTVDPETIRWAISIAAVAAAAGPLLLVVSSLITATAALAGALAVGLLPVIAIGGPILIALAAISALYVKNKLDAIEAAAAADRYRASLIGLSEGQLQAQRYALQLDLLTTRESQRALRVTGQATRTTVQPRGILDEYRRRGVAGALFPGVKEVVEETDAMKRLSAAATVAGERIKAIDTALDGLSSTKSQTTTPPITPPTGPAKRDPLAGVLDGLTDRLRELDQLQKFGVASLSVLPDDIQEKIRLVNSLAGELDTLQDGLRRFQQAGREPPAGLTFGIERLREQLAGAARDVDALAIKLSNDRLRGRVNITVSAPAVGRLPEGDTARLFSAPTEVAARGLKQNLDLLVVAPLATASMLLSAGFNVLRETVTQVGRSIFAAGDSQLKASLSAAANLAGQLTPAGLAAYALSSALEALRPFVDAMLLPVKLFGEIVAIGLVPILRILFPVIKAVAIVFSYLQEGVDRVLGGILTAAGGFVKAIGKLINAVTPFANPGNPLVKAGQAIQDAGKNFTDAAKEIAKKRKELEGLSFDDALAKTTDAAEKLTESLLNAVQGFKIARFRFDAAEAGTIPGATGGSANAVQGGAANVYNGASFQFSIQAGEKDPLDVFMDWVRTGKRLALSNPGMRPFMAQFPDFA